MSVLGLLLAMSLPMFGRAIEMSRSAKCKANLRNLAAFLHTDDGRDLDLPGGTINTITTANQWLDRVVDTNLEKLIICPNGKSRPIGMKNLWVRQNGYNNTTSVGIYFTSIERILALPPGQRPADPQVSVLYPAKGINYLGQDNEGWGWVYGLNNGPPAHNQAFISIATDASFVITIKGNTATLQPLGAHPSPRMQSGSDHYLIKGEGTEETWEEDTIARLTGKGYKSNDPAVKVYTGNVDYGMSTLVPIRDSVPSQLWITEYTTDIMRLSATHRDEAFDGEEEEGEVMGRHFGSANYVKVDGSVTSQPKKAMEIEFENIDTGVRNIFQD